MDEEIETFQQHRKIVEKEAELCNYIEAAEERALLLVNKEREEKERKGMHTKQYPSKQNGC